MQSMYERLKANQRRKNLRRLRLLILLIVLYFTVVHSWRYVHQPDFAFGNITVSGSTLLSVDDVAKMSGSGSPFNIFNASIGQLRDVLQHDIRFQKAEVNYTFPASLHVIVEERKPAVYVANSYHSYLQIDYDGFVMNVTTSIPDASAPVVLGAKCGNVFLGDKITNSDVLNILSFLQNIDEEARERIAEISIDDRKDVRILMRGSFPIILGSAADLSAKIDVFKAVFNEIKDKHIKAEYIDLTFAKPYIKLLSAEN